MNLKNLTPAISALLGLLALSPWLPGAQEPVAAKREETRPEPEDELPTAKEIVIEASRIAQSPFDLPMGASLIGRRELLERASRTPAEALRHVPGVWVQKTGHLGGAPIIRGFMGNRVIYLFDGIRRNTAGLFKGPNSFLQNIDALDVDRIEVIRGPGSVLYGSDAIGGVVNVVTNEDPRFSDSLQFGGRTYGRFSSVDQELSGRQELHLGAPRIHGFLGGSLRNIDDLRGGRGVGIQSPSLWRERDWDAQVDLMLAEGHQLGLFVQDFSRPDGRRFDRPNWKQMNDRELYGVRYRGQDLGIFSAVEATGYYHSQRNFIDEKFWDSDGADRTAGAEVQMTSYPADSVRLVYGAHLHRDMITKTNPQKGTEDPSVDWTNPALFLLSEFQATDALRVDLGIRWDQFSLKSQAPPFAKLDPAVQAAVTNGSFSMTSLQLDQTDNAITGGLGLVLSLDENINVVGNVGRAFRAPNKSDMLSFGQFTFGFNVPAPNLNPESSWTYEAGARFSYPEFTGAMTGFYTTVSDAIVSLPGTFGGSDFVDVNGNGVKDPDEQVFVKSNSPSGIVAYGVELEGSWYLPESWAETLFPGTAPSLYGNFSWVFGKDRGNNEPLDRAFPANGLLGLRIDDSRDPEQSDWWVSVEGWFVNSFDRIPSSRRMSDPAFRVNPQDKNSAFLRPDGSVPGFTVINVRGGVRMRDNVYLTLGVENLADRKYRVKDSRIDGPGTNVIVGVEVVF